MGEADEQGGHQTRLVVEDAGRVDEFQIAGDDQRTAGLAMGEQDEEQLRLVGVEADEAELLTDQQVDAVEQFFELGQPVLWLELQTTPSPTRRRW
jgi:hypothetical protein